MCDGLKLIDEIKARTQGMTQAAHTSSPMVSLFLVNTSQRPRVLTPSSANDGRQPKAPAAEPARPDAGRSRCPAGGTGENPQEAMVWRGYHRASVFRIHKRECSFPLRDEPRKSRKKVVEYHRSRALIVVSTTVAIPSADPAFSDPSCHHRRAE